MNATIMQYNYNNVSSDAQQSGGAVEQALFYKNYTAQIIADPSYYGSECTQADAIQIAAQLTAMIALAFPGIAVREWTTGGSASTLGPDQSVCDAIDQWISENWTAAL
jgi:hypothetical protein